MSYKFTTLLIYFLEKRNKKLKERLNKDNKLSIKCDYCNHVEYYKNENELFQGEMFGLKDWTTSCHDCLVKIPAKLVEFD